MKTFCKDLKKHAAKIINCEKKEMISLTNEEFNAEDKKYYNIKDDCHYTGKYRGAAHDIYNLRYETPKEITVVFHSGSTYDYHFIIKELEEEFEGQLNA